MPASPVACRHQNTIRFVTTKPRLGVSMLVPEEDWPAVAKQVVAGVKNSPARLSCIILAGSFQEMFKIRLEFAQDYASSKTACFVLL
jgi:hypothetical protein